MLASLEEPPVFQRGLFFEPNDGSGAGGSGAAGQARRGAARRPLLAQRQRQDPAVSRIVVALGEIARTLDGRCSSMAIVAIDRSGRPLGFQTSRAAFI
jgi:hypothetical protein